MKLYLQASAFSGGYNFGHMRGDQFRNVALEMGDIAHDAGGKIGVALSRHEENRLYPGVKRPVGGGYLEFIFQVGNSAQAPDHHVGFFLFDVVHQQAFEAIHRDVLLALQDGLEHPHPLLEREHMLLGAVDEDADYDVVENFGSPVYDVEVAEGDGVEAAGVNRDSLFHVKAIIQIIFGMIFSMKKAALLLFLTLSAQASAQELIPYNSGGKWGYAAPGGDLQIAASYDAAEPFNEDLALVRAGAKYGFINKAGKKVLPPSYQSAGSFSEGCAPVKARGLWGCVDKTGKALVPFEYEELLPFKEGAAPAKKGGRWGLLLRDGREFRGGIYEEIYPVSEGLARVKVNGKYGFIELSGKEALPPVYSEAFPFSAGFAAARLGDKYGFISRRTLAFKERPYVSIGPYSDGLAHAQHLEGGGRCGYIDQEGKEIIPAGFAMCASFEWGLAPVLKDFKGGWGYIDRKGKIVIGFKYEQAAGFRNGLAKVTRKGRSFYIDMSGFEYWK